MSDKTRLRLEVGIVALIFGAGGGWATYQAKLGSLQEQITNLSQQVQRIDSRVGSIFCASLPVDKQPGCR